MSAWMKDKLTGMAEECHETARTVPRSVDGLLTDPEWDEVARTLPDRAIPANALPARVEFRGEGDVG